MVEKVLYDYLNAELSVPVYLERPEQPPEQFVVIERTGGRSENHINYATFAVQSIAPTLYQAVWLNDDAVEAMNGAASLPEIGSVHLNSVYNFTHRNESERSERRYQAVFEIAYY